MITQISDFALTLEGSIALLWFQTITGKDWINEHIDPEAQRWGTSAVVIEHRYLGDIVNGIHDDGLTIKDVIDTRKAS